MKFGKSGLYLIVIESLPTRERGLKFAGLNRILGVSAVAPYTGAWIEIWVPRELRLELLVAPYTGAWIEIRETVDAVSRGSVAPYTGAWIEISLS